MKKYSREYREIKNKIVERLEFLQGTLVRIRRECGKERCRCKEGKKHTSFYISYSKRGKTHMLYVPKNKIDEAKRLIKNYKELKKLFDKLKELNRYKFKGRGIKNEIYSI